MYLRTTARANKDGSVVRYLALAHNQRVGAATKSNVLLNLGREDRLDPDGLRRLVRSINRYLGEPDTDGSDATAVTGTDTATGGLRLISSAPAGAAWLLHGLWKALDVDTALRAVLGAGSVPTSSGCCSHSSRTGPSTRPRSSPPPSGRRTTEVRLRRWQSPRTVETLV